MARSGIAMSRRSFTEVNNVLVEEDEFSPAEAYSVSNVTFHIREDGMSVASSSFDSPCRPDTGKNPRSFWSGQLQKGATFTVTNISENDTIFFYNPSDNCADGFVGAINPTTAQTVDAYRKAAEKYNQLGVMPGGRGYGGVVTGLAVEEESSGDSTTLSVESHIGVIVAVAVILIAAVAGLTCFFCCRAKRRLREKRLEQEQRGVYGGGQKGMFMGGQPQYQQYQQSQPQYQHQPQHHHDQLYGPPPAYHAG